MAKPNYAFEKRQRELAKKKKKEEKAHRKEGGRPADGEPDATGEAPADTLADGTPETGAAPAQPAPGA